MEALRASGRRAVFGHSVPTSDPSWYVGSDLRHPEDARRVVKEY